MQFGKQVPESPTFLDLEPSGNPKRFRLPKRTPKDLREGERILIIDERLPEDQDPFLAYWFAWLPMRELRRLPVEARYLPANRNFVYVMLIFGALFGYLGLGALLFFLWGSAIVAIAVAFVPGAGLGSILGFVAGRMMRPRPLWVLKRHRQGAVNLQAYKPVKMADITLSGDVTDLHVVRGSYMANVVKQEGTKRLFSISSKTSRKQEFMGMVLGGLALAVIIIFTLILSTDPELSGQTPSVPPAVTASQ